MPVVYEGARIAELAVVSEALGDEERHFLERVATLISPYSLVGWDKGGAAWQA